MREILIDKHRSPQKATGVDYGPNTNFNRELAHFMAFEDKRFGGSIAHWKFLNSAVTFEKNGVKTKFGRSNYCYTYFTIKIKHIFEIKVQICTHLLGQSINKTYYRSITLNDIS